MRHVLTYTRRGKAIVKRLLKNLPQLALFGVFWVSKDDKVRRGHISPFVTVPNLNIEGVLPDWSVVEPIEVKINTADVQHCFTHGRKYFSGNLEW